MKLKQLLLSGLLFLSISIHAQTDFRKGYVVTINNDTLFGEVDYRKDLLMGKVCRFRLNEKSPDLRYSPLDIIEYRFIDSKYYVSKDIDGKKAFLEFLLKGQVNLYYLNDEKGEHYYLEKEGVPLTEIPYEEGIRYKDNNRYFYTSTKHIGILNYFMQETPELRESIEKMGKPQHDNMISLAENYHNIVCKDQSCVIYEKPIPLFQFAIEPVFGVAKYTIFKNFLAEFGSNLYIWIPQTSENLFLKTGVVYQRINELGEKYNIFKIPLQIQYLYHAKKFQPKASFGFNFMKITSADDQTLYNTLSLNAGFNYEITKHISLSTTFNTDFAPLSKYFLSNSKNNRLLSYSLDLGLYINL